MAQVLPPSAPAAPAFLSEGRAGALVKALAVVLPLGIAFEVVLTLGTTDRHVWEATRSLPLAPLAAAVALALVPWLLNAARLQLWAGFVGSPLRFRDSLRVVLGGQLASSVTPTGTGGEILKWPLLVRYGVSAPTAGTLLAVEAVENAVFMAVALPIVAAVSAADAPAVRDALGAAGGGARPWLAGLVAVTVAGGGAVWAARAGLLGAWAQRRTRRAGRALATSIGRFRADVGRVARLVARRGKRRLALGVALAAAQWTARYSVATAVLAFLGVPVRPVLFWGLQWTTFTLTNVVPTPGAAGGAEAAFAVLYAPFVPAEVLGLATATWRMVLFYAPLTIAAVAFLAIRRPAPPREAVEAVAPPEPAAPPAPTEEPAYAAPAEA